MQRRDEIFFKISSGTGTGEGCAGGGGELKFFSDNKSPVIYMHTYLFFAASVQ